MRKMRMKSLAVSMIETPRHVSTLPQVYAATRNPGRVLNMNHCTSAGRSQPEARIAWIEVLQATNTRLWHGYRNLLLSWAYKQGVRRYGTT